LNWTSQSWRTQRGNLYVAGQLPAARRQPFRLPEGFVHAVASGQNHGDRTVHAASMGEDKIDEETDQSGSFKTSAVGLALLFGFHF
jgi:hypothetical protein